VLDGYLISHAHWFRVFENFQKQRTGGSGWYFFLTQRTTRFHEITGKEPVVFWAVIWLFPIFE
jgi:hypothetical protein